MSDRTTVIAVFDDRAQAQRAIGDLKSAGFTEKEIGVTTRDPESGDGKLARAADKGETHAKEGAVAGVAAGAGVGALWGLGILAGVLPAIGPAIAGGTLAAILSSAAAGAATAGVAGALIGLGIPEEEANYYDQEFRAGRTVVTVQAKSRSTEARSILQQAGGRSMDDAGSSAGAAMASAARDTSPEPMARVRRPARTEGAASGTRTIQAREEEVRVRKRPVETGEAEVYKEVRTENRSLDVPVKKEELVIERHSLGRQEARGSVGDNERIRIPLSEEQIDVEKRTVATEEVTVGKRTREDEEHVDTTIAKEEIKVDKRGRSGPRPSAR
jgi:uncharacterized protein (TIGR02271 family)